MFKGFGRNQNQNNYDAYENMQLNRIFSEIEEINRNLAIWSTYEPGSTFKIITLSASVQEQTVDLIHDTFYDGGSVTVEGARIKCWKKGGHGAQTFLEVVQNSCNLGVTTRTLLSSLITP